MPLLDLEIHVPIIGISAGMIKQKGRWGALFFGLCLLF